MVDWISLIVGIIAVIIAIVAVILVFTMGSGSAGPTGPVGPTGGGSVTISTYGNFGSTPSTQRVTDGVEKTFDVVLTTVKSNNINLNTTTGILTINSPGSVYCIIEGINGIFPDRGTITELSFTTVLQVDNGTGATTVVNTVSTHNLTTYSFNVFLNMAYSWSGILPAGSKVSLKTIIYARCLNGTGTVVTSNGSYMNVSCIPV
jgi:hypothetical protein